MSDLYDDDHMFLGASDYVVVSEGIKNTRTGDIIPFEEVDDEQDDDSE